MMSKEEFRDRLITLHGQLKALTMHDGVSGETALYRFLAYAETSIMFAVMDIDEFEEIKDDDKDYE